MNNLLKRILRTILCTAISFFVWFCLSKTFASTDTMYTTFENMSEESWLKITDYFYENAKETTLKSKLKNIATGGENATAFYNSLITYIKGYNDKTNYGDVIFLLRYAKSDLSSLTFILDDNYINIYTNELYSYNGGTSTDLSNYTKVEEVNYNLSLSNVNNYYNGNATSNLRYYSTTNASNNYRYIKIGLNSYSISYGTGNSSNLGSSIPINPLTLTQGLNEDDNSNIFYYYSDFTNIVQFASSGTYGNPLISFYMQDYKSGNSTNYPYLCANAVYLDGSPSTGGGSGGDSGGDEGGGGGSEGGGDTGGTSVDLSNIENTLGDINTSIIQTGQETNQNLENINQNIEDLNNSITTVPDLSEKEEITSDDILQNFDFEFTVDPYDNFWNTLLSELQSVLTTNNNRTITLEFRGKTYTISVDDFNFNSMPLILKNFLQLLTISILTYFLVCWVKKSLDLITSGDMSEVLAMNEEEGIVDLF